MEKSIGALALLCGLLGACNETRKGAAADSAVGSPRAISVAGASGGSTSKMPVGVDEALLQKICTTATCAGPLSGVQVYRNSAGRPALYLHEGDLQRCSHPPDTYFDATGKERLAQAERPIRSPEDAKMFSAERDAVLAGLVEAELLLCSDYRPREL